jgi:hypothetical protein
MGVVIMKYRVMIGAVLAAVLSGSTFAVADDYYVSAPQSLNLIGAGFQSANSNASVTNWGSIDVRGGIKGDGNSLAISATGAVTANSITNVRSSGGINAVSVQYQSVYNGGKVTNGGYIISGGSIIGDGNSVSVGATGAVAANSITNVDVYGKNGSVIAVGTQNATNTASVVNSGVIRTASLTGNASSISISALGAGAVNSITNVGGRR